MPIRTNVADAMGGEGECEGEVDDVVPVEDEAEPVVVGDGLARLETYGLGKTGGGIRPCIVPS